MKILVTGANGQLGQELMHLTSPHEIIGLTRVELDITDKEQINAAVEKIKPNIIINAAAYTKVDKAEQEKELAFAINYEAVKNVANCCAKYKIPLLQLSTDYVFSGKQTVPYREDDLTDPLNVYGASKLAGEQAIQQLLDNYIILRVSSVFSEYGNNFVKTILRLAREKEILRVVTDSVACPTSAKDIAATLIKMSECIQRDPLKNYTGIYHFCNEGPVSWHQFAEAIVKQAMTSQILCVKDIQAITSAEYPTPAQRPHYSVLDTHKIQNTFAIPMNSWRTTLTEILPRL